MEAWETLAPFFREITRNHMLRSLWDPESWAAAAHETKLELMREHLDLRLCSVHRWTGRVGKCTLALYVSTGSDTQHSAHISWASTRHTDIFVFENRQEMPSFEEGQKNVILFRDSGNAW